MSRRLRQFAFLACLFAAVLGYGQEQDKPHVGILLPYNNTGRSSFDAGAKAAGDTVNLILAQSRLYQVSQSDVPSPKTIDEASLAALAESNEWDFVVFSSLQPVRSSGAAQAVYQLGVYDRSKQAVTITKNSDPSELLDLYDAADTTVALVLGTMTGVHIGFGKIVLVPSGEKGSYEITLDGRVVLPAELDKVLNGKHEVAVQAKRMLGAMTYTTAPIVVEEGKTSQVPFVIPYLTDDETAAVAAKDKKVEQLWTDFNKAAQVEAALDSYDALLRDVAYAPRVADLRLRVADLRKAWAKIQAAKEKKRDFDGPMSKRNTLDVFGWTFVTAGVASLVASAYPLYMLNTAYPKLVSTTSSATYNSSLAIVNQNRLLAYATLGGAAACFLVSPLFFSLGPNRQALDNELGELDDQIAQLRKEAYPND